MTILWGKYYYIRLPNGEPQVHSVSKRTPITWVCAQCPGSMPGRLFPKVHVQNMLPMTLQYILLWSSHQITYHSFRDSSPILPIRKVRHSKAKNSLNFPLSDLWRLALKSGPLPCPEAPGYSVEFIPQVWGRNGTLTLLLGSILGKNSLTRRAEWQYRTVPGNYWCLALQHIFYLLAQGRSFPRPACRARLLEGFQISATRFELQSKPLFSCPLYPP